MSIWRKIPKREEIQSEEQWDGSYLSWPKEFLLVLHLWIACMCSNFSPQVSCHFLFPPASL